MSTTIRGTVTNVKKGRPFTFKSGPQAGKQGVSNIIDVEADGKVTSVIKNSLVTTAFNLAIGTEVQVTFDTQEVQLASGDVIINNKLANNGLLVFEAGNTQPQQITSSGQVKPVFTPTNNSSKSGPKAEYDQNGARNGMIGNAAVALAAARGTLDVGSLVKASDDIKTLLAHIENATPSTTLAGTVQQKPNTPAQARHTLKQPQSTAPVTSTFKSKLSVPSHAESTPFEEDDYGLDNI